MNPIRVEAGSLHSVKCPICDDLCAGQFGLHKPNPTGMASAMAWHGVPDDYDEFMCPHDALDWHKQAEAMKRERDKSASPSVRQLIENDITYVLCSKMATVPISIEW
jgi:hypothetical protein